MRFLTSCICFIALVFTLHTPLQTDDMTAAVVAAVGGDTTGMTALESASTGGMPRLSRALARLESHRRLLMLAAHPDDEDTRALAWLAQTGGEAAYLSLNRGEGGQNLIGDELGVGLGLIRSRELLAARQVDGARQYFSRAYDFGFTRSLDETLTRWSREVLIEDSVRVIRRFKPQVLVSVFPPDERAGHGHHQAAGVLAAEVIEAAADPTLFPELGPAWRVTTLFRSAWWDPSAATVRFSLGTLDRFNGRSIMQTALASRSQHRSQDMGLVQPLGHATGALIWESGGDGTPSTELFTGVDTELEAIAALLPEGETRDAVAAHLFDIASRAGLTRWSVLTLTPQEAASAVAQIVQALDEAISIVSGIESDGAIHARQLLVEKRSIAVEALATAAGIAADAWTDREEVVAGAELEVQAELWSSAGVEVGEVRIEPRGWPLVSSTEREAEGRRFRTEVTAARTLVVQVPADARPTVPYFLENPLDGDLFDWTGVPDAVKGEPFAPAPLAAHFHFTVDGVPITLEREVVLRERDQAFGEVRRPIRVVPEYEIAIHPSTVVWPLGRRTEQTLDVAVLSNRATEGQVQLEIDAPEGWPAIPRQTIDMAPGERRFLEVVLRAPDDLQPGRYPFAVALMSDTGERFAKAIDVIDYPHIRPTTRPLPAAVEVAAGSIELPPIGRIGYVRGASDRVPEMLEEIGLEIDLLHAGLLAEGNFSNYDAIVIGPRAYETDPALREHNGRILDYLRAGGLVISQYQQYQFVQGRFAPLELTINRPHDRVTDETAAVTLLEPNHPVFTTPNRLDANDWLGWVQERGLYFAGTWDDGYQPLLAMADPDGIEKRGSLLVANVGEGTYVYTGVAFFRQLPAGVVGAYRLFVNLLAL